MNTLATGGSLLGVVGTAPLPGAAFMEGLRRLRDGSGSQAGGVALVGCFPHRPKDYALNIATLAPEVRRQIEHDFLDPSFEVVDIVLQPVRDDVPGLAVRPPRVVRYFLRAKEDARAQFAALHGFGGDMDAAEAEMVAQTVQQIDSVFYAAQETAFVMSAGRDMMILKGAGCAADVARFYRLDEYSAQVWLGCQQISGAVWPQPFGALDAAVALDGSFANADALVTYLRQRSSRPHFRTEAELAARLFDFYARTCGYRLELVMEALMPTAALDRLSPARRTLYRALQHTHAHGMPEGPALLTVARHRIQNHTWELMGITDANARRPNVFALQAAGACRVGAVASSYPAIAAVMDALAGAGLVPHPVPDAVWSAERHEDGGAYCFTVTPGEGEARLACRDKFGRLVMTAPERVHVDDVGAGEPEAAPFDPDAPYEAIEAALREWTFKALDGWLEAVLRYVKVQPAQRGEAVALLSRLYDRAALYETGQKARSAVRAHLVDGLAVLFHTPALSAREADAADPDRRLTWERLAAQGIPIPTRGTLYIDAASLPAEGSNSPAQVLVRGHAEGWRRFVVFGCRGVRCLGCGLGASLGTRLDVYGAAGDYLAAGLDGAEVHMHGRAENRVGYRMRRGRLVIYGDVGQDFLRGAVGGEVHVWGRAQALEGVGEAVHVVVHGGGR